MSTRPVQWKLKYIADTLNWKENIYPYMRRFIIIKMSIVPQSVYKLNMVSIKFPEGLLGETGKMTL